MITVDRIIEKDLTIGMGCGKVKLRRGRVVASRVGSCKEGSCLASPRTDLYFGGRDAQKVNSRLT